ncbi:MAG: dienelactone hydrolase family protein [Gammaproteobacteria bacterium]|nr:dienelactone hydrolase family protein [Gammaproteobacteria bacterium]
MMLKTQSVNYQDGDTLLEGFLAYDDAHPGPRPAVMISHAWGGRDAFACDQAQRLAELGYVGFAMDMYGKGVTGSGPDENAALMQPFLDDRSVLQGRMKKSLEVLQQLDQVDAVNIAAMGYCFGGLCVLDLARTGVDIKGVVSFHGLFGAPGNTTGNRIKARVLALHGHDDPMVPVDDVIALEKELTDAGADWQIHVYGNVMHAFTNPAADDPGFGTVYNKTADTRSWQSLRGFLAELFD